MYMCVGMGVCAVPGIWRSEDNLVASLWHQFSVHLYMDSGDKHGFQPWQQWF